MAPGDPLRPMSRITLFAFAGLLTALAVAGVASAEWYEGKPECPPDHACTMSYGDEPEYSDENDTSPACEECSGPAPERGDGDGDASDDCFETEEGGLVCYRNAGGDCAVQEDGTKICESHGDGPSMPIDCGGAEATEGSEAEPDPQSGAEVCAYDGGGCDAPTSSMDRPNATAKECPSLGGPADDPGPVDAPEEDSGTETQSDARRDAPAGALVGALAALAGVAVALRKP